MGQEPIEGGGERTPAFNQPRFECPHCGAFAAMDWHQVNLVFPGGSTQTRPEWIMAACLSCAEFTVWLNQSLIYPGVRLGPAPNPDMPGEVKALYQEARAVSTTSPRSAAGLLRLGLQVLIDDLVEGNGSINDKIGALVKTGLSPVIQRAMDTVRVAGNNAVHPGTIQVHDDPDQLATLLRS